MFDKIPSLKDFILYVIPGIVYCYFVLDIYNHFYSECYSCDDIANSLSLSFIGIIFSFIVGFFLSQLQIILFGKLFEHRFKKMRTIGESQKSNEEIKKTLIKRIKEVFEINSVSENDDLIIFLCLNFVKVKTNENSHIFIDRQNNLSSFAMTVLLPILLAIFDFSLKMKFNLFVTIIILLVMLGLLIYLVWKIVFNFRDDYYKNIFRQFIVLSKSNVSYPPASASVRLVTTNKSK
ncbi:MAG: hypothetical protein V4548_11000 [Bacteroidota bacterium]